MNHLVLAVALFPLVAAGATHPQTVWDAAELQRLRAGRTTTHAALAANLKAYLERFAGGGLGHNVAGYAMGSRVFADARYEAAAVSMLASFCSTGWSGDLDLTQSSDLLNGTIAYDVLYDLLSPAQRDGCRNRIAASATTLANAASNGTWWVPDLVQNHNWVNFASIGLAGQALEGEHAAAAGWRALAAADFVKVKQLQDLITDGSWHEGVGYMEFGLERAIAYHMGAARRGSDSDQTRMLAGLGRYILSVQQPDHPRVHVMTHGDWNWSRPGLQVVLRWAARRSRDPLAQEAGRRWDLEPRLGRSEFGLSYALEYVAYDPTVPLPDMSKVPLDLYAGDQQTAVLRSSWDFGNDSRSIVVGFKAGVFGGRGNFERMRTGAAPGGMLNFSHDHEDDLGLWIYGNGGWLLPEAAAYNCCYGSSEYHSTSWHNTFLVDGQGQLGDGKQPSHDGKSFGDSHPWFFEREASMPVHVSTDHYGFATGEGAKLYPSSLGVTRMSRSVAIAREGGYVVLRDEVETSAARSVDQLFHSMGPASQDGAWLKLVNLADSALGIRVFSPASPAVRLGTQVSNHYQENMDDDGIYRQVKVAPPAAATRAVFLELLWPVRASEWANGRPAAAPLEASRPQRGLVVPLGSATETWTYESGAGLSLEGGAAGDVGIRRAAATGRLERLVVVGRGRLEDQAGARTLLDLGTSEGALEVAFTGAAADLSGTAAIAGVRFYGPDVTVVRHGGAEVGWTRSGPMVTVQAGPPPPVDGGLAPVDAGTRDAGAPGEPHRQLPEDADAGGGRPEPDDRVTSGCGAAPGPAGSVGLATGAAALLCALRARRAREGRWAGKSSGRAG